MFIAGAIPGGLMMGGAMMITAWIIAKRRNFPRQAWMGWGAS